MKSDGLTVHSSRVESIVERAEGTRLEEGSRHGNARTTMIGERHSQTTRTRTAEARRVSTGTPERRTAVERTKKTFKILLAAAAIWGRWSKGSQDEDFNSYIRSQVQSSHPKMRTFATLGMQRRQLATKEAAHGPKLLPESLTASMAAGSFPSTARVSNSNILSCRHAIRNCSVSSIRRPICH